MRKSRFTGAIPVSLLVYLATTQIVGAGWCSFVCGSTPTKILFLEIFGRSAVELGLNWAKETFHTRL